MASRPILDRASAVVSIRLMAVRALTHSAESWDSAIGRSDRRGWREVAVSTPPPCKRAVWSFVFQRAILVWSRMN